MAKTIVLTGGGTMGAVSPLLAVRERMLERQGRFDFVWIGTEAGIEREIVSREGIEYKGIKAAKLRRYFSLALFVDPFRFIVGFFQAWALLKKIKPEFILTCGGYVSVPVVLAGYLRKIKIIVHQQDIQVGLANKIMAPFATKITVSVDFLSKKFPKEKTILLGNPVRSRIFSGKRESAVVRFKLRGDLPVLLVLGGSLGSEWINKMIYDCATELTSICEILHVTGKANIARKLVLENYHQFEYLNEELADAYAVSDLVVARAGFSTLTELAVLGKAAVIIPIPGNQQEKNAAYFNSKNAVVYLSQTSATKEDLLALLRKLISDTSNLRRLGGEITALIPKDSTDKMVDLLYKM